MTNEQILKKAIEKAVKGGYSKSEADDFLEVVYDQFASKSNTQECFVTSFIFSYSFAKAFFGEEEVTTYGYTKETYYQKAKLYHQFGKLSWMEDAWNREAKILSWQYHLQTMVLKVKYLQYLKYIEKFLKK